MTRMHFDHRRDQAVADDFEAGQSLNCAAQGCPNLWSVDQGQGRLCSWHHWAGPHQWPHITAELQEEARRRASRLERERADIIDRFKAAIRVTPEIMTGYYVTGDSDFVLVVTARDMEDFEQFTRRFFYENPDVRGFKTMVVIDRVKAGFALPIS